MSSESKRPTECCADLREKFAEWKARAEKSVREDPVKTAGLALVAGIFLSILPVGAFLSAIIRIVFALARPALLILGVIKLAEEYDRRK